MNPRRDTWVFASSAGDSGMMDSFTKKCRAAGNLAAGLAFLIHYPARIGFENGMSEFVGHTIAQSLDCYPQEKKSCFGNLNPLHSDVYAPILCPSARLFIIAIQVFKKNQQLN